MNLHKKQIAALRLAIEVLKRERRAHFAVGEAAYRSGIRSNQISDDGITGTGFLWAENDHKEYRRYSGAIQEMEDLIEILEDPGVTFENHSDLPLFAETHNV